MGIAERNAIGSTDFFLEDGDPEMKEMYSLLSEALFGVENPTNPHEDDTSHGKFEDMDLDSVLAQVTGNLSLQEQEETMRDVYGVREIMEETPQFVQEHLAKLEGSIAKISIKVGYDKAYDKAPEYVREFRLMALRTERFDPDLAANHMVNFFDKKMALFGEEKLTRDIQISDLDPEKDIPILESGVIQLLPSRDRSGRDIIMIVPKLLKGSLDNSLVRVVRWLHLVGSEIVNRMQPETKKQVTHPVECFLLRI